MSGQVLGEHWAPMSVFRRSPDAPLYGPDTIQLHLAFLAPGRASGVRQMPMFVFQRSSDAPLYGPDAMVLLPASSDARWAPYYLCSHSRQTLRYTDPARCSYVRVSSCVPLMCCFLNALWTTLAIIPSYSSYSTGNRFVSPRRGFGLDYNFSNNHSILHLRSRYII